MLVLICGFLMNIWNGGVQKWTGSAARCAETGFKRCFKITIKDENR